MSRCQMNNRLIEFSCPTCRRKWCRKISASLKVDELELAGGEEVEHFLSDSCSGRIDVRSIGDLSDDLVRELRREEIDAARLDEFRRDLRCSIEAILTDDEPTMCGNCGSEDIDVDDVGSERLWRKRHPEEAKLQVQEEVREG